MNAMTPEERHAALYGGMDRIAEHQLDIERRRAAMSAVDRETAERLAETMRESARTRVPLTPPPGLFSGPLPGLRRRIGIEDVQAHIEANRERIDAQLRAQTDATLAELMEVHPRPPTPAWTGTPDNLWEDLRRVAHEIRRHAAENRLPVQPIEITEDQLEELRACAGYPSDAPTVSSLWGVPVRVLPAATPGPAGGRDVVEEIDDVLTDWNGSADSARWRPPPGARGSRMGR